MRTLILNDELWEEMTEALLTSERGRKALKQLKQGLTLPPDRELIGLARSKADAPEVVRRAVEFRDAGRQAAEDTRLALEELLLDAWNAGVGPGVLSEWFGLKQSRVYEILAPARAQT